MIIITGASGGIGNYLYKSFIKDGHQVKGTYNNNKPLFNENDFYKVDLSQPKEVESWIESIKKELKQITLINCIGINYNKFGHKSELDEWRNVIDVNLIGSFNAIKYLLPYMREDRFGRIINFSSIVPQIGVAGTSAYSASKSGLWGLTKSLAKENAQLGITINSLNLGYFDIGMISVIPEKMLENIKESIPAKRLGKPEEIYEIVKSLISIEYINGANLDINGGL